VHRATVLALLQQYQSDELDLHEARMLAVTLRFVETEPNCLRRECTSGHLTGSAWVVSPDRTKVLLTHHRKLDKWLQLGGHADGEPDLWAVAEKEALEETGLPTIRAVSKRIFDLDRHAIPAHANVPAHFHYDLRFLFEADPSAPLLVSNESKSLAWVPLDQVSQLNPEASMLRMIGKTR
jgi:8-oxo-dGTP pyrophosphatase MutT (NUDIX family)